MHFTKNLVIPTLNTGATEREESCWYRVDTRNVSAHGYSVSGHKLMCNRTKSYVQHCISVYINMPPTSRIFF